MYVWFVEVLDIRHNLSAQNRRKGKFIQLGVIYVELLVQLVLVITCLGGQFGINCPSAFLKIFVLVKRGQFQNFQKS